MNNNYEEMINNMKKEAVSKIKQNITYVRNNQKKVAAKVGKTAASVGVGILVTGAVIKTAPIIIGTFVGSLAGGIVYGLLNGKETYEKMKKANEEKVIDII